MYHEGKECGGTHIKKFQDFTGSELFNDIYDPLDIDQHHLIPTSMSSIEDCKQECLSHADCMGFDVSITDDNLVSCDNFYSGELTFTEIKESGGCYQKEGKASSKTILAKKFSASLCIKFNVMIQHLLFKGNKAACKYPQQ